MTILKGGVDGFSYFSSISVILFSNQDHPCIIIILEYRQRRQNMLLEIFKKKKCFYAIKFMLNTCRGVRIHRGYTLYCNIMKDTLLGFFLHCTLLFHFSAYKRQEHVWPFCVSTLVYNHERSLILKFSFIHVVY